MAHNMMIDARRINAAIRLKGTLHRIATALDREITTISGERLPFALLIWTNGRANYVSNTNDRAAMKASIGALILGWDDDPPAAAPDAPAP